MSTDTIASTEQEYTGQLNWGLWRRVLGFTRPRRRSVWALILVGIVVGAMEGIMPLITRGIINDVDRHGMDGNFAWYCAAYLVAGFVMCSGVWLFIRLGAAVSTGMAHDIRRDGFAKLQELSFSYYDRRPVGWLVARMTSDCDRLCRTIAWGLLDITWGTCMLVGVGVCMFVLNWKLALVVMTVLPLMGGLSLVVQRRLLATSRKVRRTNSAITAAFNEAIMGVRTTKTLVRESENLGEFGLLTDQMRTWSVRTAVLTAAYFPMLLSLGSIAGALVLWRGGGAVLDRSMDIGTLLAFISYTGALMFPILELARVFAEMQTAQAAAERILDLLATEPEIKDSPQVVAALARDHSRTAGAAVDGGDERIESIEFRNVSFAYKEGKEVLKNFNLTVVPGKTVALVGPTGGGKTTIVSLLCRFYEPSAGEILINGVDYRRRSLRWLQSNLGIVLQEPQLFSGTIRRNIRYGNLAADNERVEWAAKLVNAHEFTMEFERGYETDIGEGGNRLSTGQKQLVSFARAVLADPQVFVMDEATSSVDTETERLIQSGLQQVLAGRISFVVAHRLSTVRSADLILVIEDGRVVERGSHSELIDLGGEYFQLYTNQFSRQRQEQVLKGEEQ